MEDAVPCQRYGTTGVINPMGTHSRSESGRSA
jgi:hypothetical protein